MSRLITTMIEPFDLDHILHMICSDGVSHNFHCFDSMLKVLMHRALCFADMSSSAGVNPIR